jgi:hypothetical protein
MKRHGNLTGLAGLIIVVAVVALGVAWLIA